MFAYRCILCNWTTPLLQSEMCDFSLSFEYSVCIHTQTFLNWNAHSIHSGCVMHNLEPCYELGENANICYIFSFGCIHHFQLQHKPTNQPRDTIIHIEIINQRDNTKNSLNLRKLQKLNADVQMSTHNFKWNMVKRYRIYELAFRSSSIPRVFVCVYNIHCTMYNV